MSELGEELVSKLKSLLAKILSVKDSHDSSFSIDSSFSVLKEMRHNSKEDLDNGDVEDRSDNGRLKFASDDIYFMARRALMDAERMKRISASQAKSQRLLESSAAPDSIPDLRSGTAPGAASLASEHNLSNQLTQLIQRVNKFESDYQSSNTNSTVPKTYMSLIEELKNQIIALNSQIDEYKRNEEKDRNSRMKYENSWDLEKAQLMSEITRCRNDLAELSGTASSYDVVRGRYESALKSAQEALEEQTSAAREEVNRLQDIITEKNSIIHSLNQELADTAKSAKHDGMQSQPAETLVGVLKMQQLLDSTNDELEKSHDKLNVFRNHHEQELRQIKKSTDMIVRSLQIEVDSLRHALETNAVSSRLASYENEIKRGTVTEGVLESLNEKFRSTARKYEAKRIELEAIQNAIASASTSHARNSHAYTYTAESSSDYFSAPPIDAPVPPMVSTRKLLAPTNVETDSNIRQMAMSAESFKYQMEASQLLRQELEDKLAVANREVLLYIYIYILTI